MFDHTERSPETRLVDNPRVRTLCDFWSSIEDAGGASWEVLDRLAQEVTASLREDPPDVRQAESLTAKAMLLIEGCTEC